MLVPWWFVLLPDQKEVGAVEKLYVMVILLCIGSKIWFWIYVVAFFRAFCRQVRKALTFRHAINAHGQIRPLQKVCRLGG